MKITTGDRGRLTCEGEPGDTAFDPKTARCETTLTWSREALALAQRQAGEDAVCQELGRQMLRRARAAEETAAGRSIKVWRFSEAPAELRALSDHGGDEDWLALIPPHLADAWIPWLPEDGQGGPFGACTASWHTLRDGSVVVIGAHA